MMLIKEVVAPADRLVPQSVAPDLAPVHNRRDLDSGKIKHRRGNIDIEDHLVPHLTHCRSRAGIENNKWNPQTLLVGSPLSRELLFAKVRTVARRERQ